jgi:hypothetical protein
MIHCCNLYHIFGSGIAYFIGKKYPEAYKADLETENGCESKLGSFSKATTNDGKMIYNLYAMYGIGNDGNPMNRNLAYDHFYDGIYKICDDVGVNPIRPIIIGIPKYIGCCRAGGNWNIIDIMLQEIEKDFPDVEFHIYELENGEMSAQSTNPTPR